MSLRVAIACEDHTHDQYIVKPVVERLLSAIDYPRAQVRVISDPRTRGIEDLTLKAYAITQRYAPLVDALIFAVDADQQDGRAGRRNRKASLEGALNECGELRSRTVVVTALQELEVWALWGSRRELPVSWHDIRAEPHPKEAFFDNLITRADLRAPGKGRLRMIKKSLEAGWDSLKEGCNELEVLEAELRQILRETRGERPGRASPTG